MAKEKKQFAFVLYPGVRPLELIGALTVFAGSDRLGAPFTTVAVGGTTAPLASDTALRVLPSATFADVPRPHALVVPGSGSAAIRAMGDDELVAYVRSAAETAELVVAIGTGALILAAAGLLDGRQATTHWAYAGLLEALGTRYLQVPWVEDETYVTAAGVSAGIDVSLLLAARLATPADAEFIQQMMEYDPRPPFGGIDWSNADGEAYVRAHFSDEDLAAAREALQHRPDLLAAFDAWRPAVVPV